MRQQYKCTWKHAPKYYTCWAASSIEAAQHTWQSLGAPDPFCVDVEQLEQLPLLSADIIEMEDTDVDGLFEPDSDPTLPSNSW